MACGPLSSMCGLALVTLSMTHVTTTTSHAYDHNAIPPTVTTACGQMEGMWDPAYPGVATFLGIPFAAPPVGELRWRPPKAPSCWTPNTTFHATQQQPACVQFRNEEVPQSESCLFLNVFTTRVTNRTVAPNTDDIPTADNTTNADLDLVPVLVWVYGGGSVDGSTTSYGDVQSVVPNMKGDVVLVAISYRLGSFGYLALKELSATDPRGVSGNYGVMDVQESLRWVQRNIVAFGGDPKRVTVFGQSSGGTQVLALLASPASNSLFSSAMSLSGSPNISMPLETMEDQGRGLVVAVGCEHHPDVLKCMYSLNTSMLKFSTPSYWSYEGNFDTDTKSPHPVHYPGLVIVDGVTVTVPLEKALARALVDVPILFSTMQAELGCSSDKMAWRSPTDFDHFCDTQFVQWNNNASAIIATLYVTTAHTNASFAYATLSSDVGVSCGNAKLAVIAGGAFESPVYLAVNTHWPSTGENPFPFHTFDTTCAFETWEKHNISPRPSDRVYGATIRSVWYALASEGRLPPELTPVTAAAGFPTSYDTLLLNENVSVVHDFKTTACNGLAHLGLDEKFWWVN
eukprot:m.266211 g.266211  ORF g.266211 m.266211 type:complete len:571 (-) comp65927_c0_seq1:66-1778(-)